MRLIKKTFIFLSLLLFQTFFLTHAWGHEYKLTSISEVRAGYAYNSGVSQRQLLIHGKTSNDEFVEVEILLSGSDLDNEGKVGVLESCERMAVLAQASKNKGMIPQSLWVTTRGAEGPQNIERLNLSDTSSEKWLFCLIK